MPGGVLDDCRRPETPKLLRLAHIGERLEPGLSTADIDRWVREDTARLGGKPSQLGYHGFPAAVCTSRNNVVCHGIPSALEILVEGDIVIPYMADKSDDPADAVAYYRKYLAEN